MYRSGEERLGNDTLREFALLRVHESGLPVYFCSKPGFHKRYACFATSYGSLDASFLLADGRMIAVPDGIAHFLEHKVFEREHGNALDLFSRRGASCNAYTSFAVTNYLFSCGEQFFAHLDALLEFVLTPYITPENVEKEKSIIAQEIRMYQDHPGWRIFTNLLEALYHEHPVRRDIAGTVESIQGIDTEQLYTCHRTFYQPGNMILFGIGDESPEQFFDQVDRTLTRFPDWRERPAATRVRPTEAPTVRDAARTLRMEIAMPQLLLGIKDRAAGRTGRAFLAQELITDLLLQIVFGKSSAFYERAYQAELIDDTFSVDYSAHGDVGFSLLSGDTPDPDRLTAEVREEMLRMRATGIEAADFERQQRAAMGSFFRHFNSLEFTANNFCAYRFQGVNLFDIIDVLHGITREDLEARLAEHLVPDAVATSTLLPRAVEVVA